MYAFSTSGQTHLDASLCVGQSGNPELTALMERIVIAVIGLIGG